MSDGEQSERALCPAGLLSLFTLKNRRLIIPYNEIFCNGYLRGELPLGVSLEGFVLIVGKRGKGTEGEKSIVEVEIRQWELSKRALKRWRYAERKRKRGERYGYLGGSAILISRR